MSTFTFLEFLLNQFSERLEILKPTPSIKQATIFEEKEQCFDNHTRLFSKKLCVENNEETTNGFHKKILYL